jgi:hypothetical protein
MQALIRARLDPDHAESAAEALDPLVDRPFPDPIFEGLSALLRSELALTTRNPAQAQALAEKGLEGMARAQVKPLRAQLQLNRARALRDLGQIEAARTALREGRRLAAELGSRWSLMSLTLELWDLEREAGDSRAAGSLAGEARPLIGAIADSIPDEDLKRAFLAKPQIRDLPA